MFSFEFFPPKTEEGLANLFSAIAELRTLRPDFVSVTYGAGGSTASKTIEIVHRIKEEHGLEAMAHFTCVGSTVDQLRATLDDMAAVGVDNVLALRGDPPAGQEEWTKTPGGLEFSRDLVDLIRSDYPFSIGAACFPETHIHASSAEDDLFYLKQKVDAGAAFLITQLFFDNGLYFDFVRRARDIGITVPIVPGILPITNVKQLERITSLCGAIDPAPAAPRAALARRPARGRARLRRGLRHAAVHRAAGPRRSRDPLLHAQPLAGHARDPQRAQAAAPVGGRALRHDLDVELLRHRRAAVGALVAHVDRVVLAVGPDAPRAEEPAPAADAVLAQLAARTPARPPARSSRGRAAGAPR